jgi:LysR family transcriptional regulator, regulator for bpeEF and oprC
VAWACIRCQSQSHNLNTALRRASCRTERRCGPQGAPRIWGFHGRFGPITHQPKGAFRTNDAEQIRTAVLADLGIAHTPGWLFASEIASGAVRPVLVDYEPARLSISVVRPGGRFLASKVRVFIDFLAEIFAQDPSLAL